MIKNRNETSAAMDKALKNLEQAKARYEAERKKENGFTLSASYNMFSNAFELCQSA